MAQHALSQLLSHYLLFLTRSHPSLATPFKAASGKKDFSWEERSPGEAMKKHERRNLEEFTPTHLQEIPRSIVSLKVSKNPLHFSKAGSFLWQVDFKAATVSSWNLSQGWNVRSSPRREGLMYKMQVRQPERHDECNLSQGSAIYHNGITGNKQSREADR